jgi:hypothetical protein
MTLSPRNCSLRPHFRGEPDAGELNSAGHDEMLRLVSL